MTNEQKTEYLEFAKQLARQAGEIMRKYFDNQADYHFKQDKTIVTIADEEINQLVINQIKTVYPTHDINGEEASDISGSQYLWVCDPVDGTALFARSIPMSVFSIALVVNGAPQIGVVYDPFQDRLYSAALGRGAYMNDKKMTVHDNDDLNPMLNFEWWPTAAYNIMPAIEQITNNGVAYCVSVGSATHSTMLVAAGKFVASIFPGTKGKNVDIAAAKVIVEEAGGKVTDFYGNDQRYDQDINGAVVSNGVVHDTILGYLKNVSEVK